MKGHLTSMRAGLYSMLLVVASACGARHPVPPGDASSQEGFGPPTPIVLAGVEDVHRPFRLRSGDNVSVRIVSYDTLDLPSLTVDPDGFIVVPLVGRIAVADKEIGAAERALQDRARQLDRTAVASLSLVEPSGHRVTVTGAVERPSVVVLKSPMRLADVLATTGGGRVRESDGQGYELADWQGGRVVRNGVALPVSLLRALQGDPRHNVRLEANDHVYVPFSRGNHVAVLGSVRAPRLVPFWPGMRLSTAIAMVGGTTKEADNGDVRVVRGSLSEPKLYHASLRGIVSGRPSDVMLMPGDIVYVSEHWFATAMDVVQRLTPALLSASLAAAIAK